MTGQEAYEYSSAETAKAYREWVKTEPHAWSESGAFFDAIHARLLALHDDKGRFVGDEEAIRKAVWR